MPDITASRAETTTTDILILGWPSIPLNFRPGKLHVLRIEHGVIAPLQRIQLGLARRGLVGAAPLGGAVFFLLLDSQVFAPITYPCTYLHNHSPNFKNTWESRKYPSHSRDLGLVVTLPRRLSSHSTVHRRPQQIIVSSCTSIQQAYILQHF